MHINTCNNKSHQLTLSVLQFKHRQNLDVLHRLGRGSTSYVFKTKQISNNSNYAMKVIDKLSENYNKSNLLHQLQIHNNLHHGNICEYITHFQDEQNHYILTQYCNKGEITKFLMQGSFVQEKIIIQILWQIGNALRYLHYERGIAHGDIKLSNILIKDQSYVIVNILQKLCDFGFAVQLDSHSNTKQCNNSNNNITGTLMYMAPQIFKTNSKLYPKQADIWAFGICILTLMLRKNPYQVQLPNLLKNKIINAEYVKISKHNFPMYSQDLIQLLKKMLEPQINKRINIEEVLCSPLFNIYNKNRTKNNDVKLSMQSQLEFNNIENKRQINTITNSKQNISDNIALNTSQKQQYEQQQYQYQQNNKTISNISTDTTTDSISIQQSNSILIYKNKNNNKNIIDTKSGKEQRKLQNQSIHNSSSNSNKFNNNITIWSYCLKPQKYDTAVDGFIQIKDNHHIYIKISAVQYTIQADGSYLTILKGIKTPKKYLISQSMSPKVTNLLNYAVQLITILKNKLAIKQKIIEGKYYYITKNILTCRLNDDGCVIEQSYENQCIIMYNGSTTNGKGYQGRVIKQGDEQYEGYKQILDKGWAYFDLDRDQ